MTRDELLELLRHDTEIQKAVAAAFGKNLDRSLAAQGKTSIGLEPDELEAILTRELMKFPGIASKA